MRTEIVQAICSTIGKLVQSYVKRCFCFAKEQLTLQHYYAARAACLSERISVKLGIAFPFTSLEISRRRRKTFIFLGAKFMKLMISWNHFGDIDFEQGSHTVSVFIALQ